MKFLRHFMVHVQTKDIYPSTGEKIEPTKDERKPGEFIFKGSCGEVNFFKRVKFHKAKTVSRSFLQEKKSKFKIK